MSFSLEVKNELEAVSRKYFTRHKKQSNIEEVKKNRLREMFIQAGTISDPNKAYHIEIAAANEEEVREILDIISFFNLHGKTMERKEHPVVYIKDATQIVSMLSIMGASKSMMEMENIRITKEMRNSINRQVNCEAANLGKAMSASVKQVEDIRYISSTVGLEELPECLAMTAKLRLEQPDATLKELGEMLNPVIGKSGINHRLRRISEIAQKLKEENNYD